ncbi:MAG TPA: hypothetical protein VGB55_14980, partial [Tepidisphaeraceae bacterium]
MYGFFDKHGKKFLIVASVLLILAFLLPGNFAPQAGNVAIGTLNGEKIDPVEVEAVANGLRSLSNLVTPAPRQLQATGDEKLPLPVALLGEWYEKFVDDPMTYYLLVREAQRAGVVPNETRVEQALQLPTQVRSTEFSGTREINRINPRIVDNYRRHLTLLMSVVDNFTRSQRAVKISDPMIDQALAERAQQIKLHAAAFDASEFDNQVSAPIDDMLRAHFDAFAAVKPGQVDPQKNPFGFGYAVPDRAKIQYLFLPNEEITRSVQASKSPDQWEEDARLYYLRNPGQFTTAPRDLMQDNAPTSQPTTRPFEQAREDVMKAVQAPLIAQRRQAIL